MPRRTITLGRQSPTFDFQDDGGPLVNGLAYAASSWLNSGRDRAEIEMKRDALAKEEGYRTASLQRQDRNDADARSFREQDLALRKQEGERRVALDESAAGRHQADIELRQGEAKRLRDRDAAEAGAKLRDDAGAVGKYALDWFRGGNPSGSPKAGSEGMSEAQAWKQALDIAQSEAGRDELGALKPVDRKRVQDVYEGLRGGRIYTPPVAGAEPQEIPPHIQAQQVMEEPARQAEAAQWRGNQPGGPGSGSLSQLALGASAPAPVRAPAPVAPGAMQNPYSSAMMMGGMGYGAQVNAPSGATPPPSAPAPAAPVDPAAQFLQLGGVNPHPDTGLTVQDFIGPDEQKRATALSRLPALDRLKAIKALRAMGYN